METSPPAQPNHFCLLKSLRFKRMPNWVKWHIPECEEIYRELGIIDCPKLIEELPRQLSSLQRLEIGGCHKLVLPNGQLGIFQGDVKQFSSLSVLKISWMENLKELCRELKKLASPEYLEIYNCGSILPFPMSYLPASLKTLVCDTCRNLELESETWQSGSLVSLGLLNGCRSLKALSLGSFHMLKQLRVNLLPKELRCSRFLRVRLGIKPSK